MRALILAADLGIEEAVKWKKPNNPAGRPRPVARRHHLHRRDPPGKGRADVCERSTAPLLGRPVQRQPRQHTMRAIDIAEGREIDEDAFNALVRAAIAYNCTR